MQHALPWNDRDALRAEIIALARGEGPTSHRAIWLLSGLPHPETQAALIDLGCSDAGAARMACSALGELHGLELSPEILSALLTSAAIQPRPGAPLQATKLLRGVRSEAAEQVAAAWLIGLSDDHLNQLLLNVTPRMALLWDVWRTREPADALSLLVAIKDWAHPPSRRRVLESDLALTDGQQRRLHQVTMSRTNTQLIDDFEGWPVARARALSELLLSTDALVWMFGVEAVVGRCREVLETAASTLAELASREPERQERFDQLTTLAATAPLVSGVLTKVIKGGWQVRLGVTGSMYAFLPHSQLEGREIADKASRLGERRCFRVLKHHDRSATLVLTRLTVPDPPPEGPSPLDVLLRESPPFSSTIDETSLRRLSPLIQRALALLEQPALSHVIDELLTGAHVPPWLLHRPLRLRWLEADAPRALTWIRSLDPGELRQEAATDYAIRCGRRPTPDHIPLLRWLLTDPVPVRRYAAIHGLHRLGEAPHLDDDPHPLVQVRALAVRAEAGDARARADLLAAARARDRCSGEALRWVATAAPEEALGVLTAGMKADLQNQQFLYDHSAGAAAAVGLAALNTEAAWSTLLEVALTGPYEASAAVMELVLRGLKNDPARPIAPFELLERHAVERRFER